jgi:hypothetical protein
MNIKSRMKERILPSGVGHTVMTGALRGLTLEMNLRDAFQLWIGCYERETYKWLHRFAAGCSSGIDVGAAQGEFTLYLLKRT